MKKRREIIKRIAELKPEFEKAEDIYFSTIQEKQGGEDVYHADFLKIESEYELLKKEIETLQWVIYGDSGEQTKKRDEDSLSHQEG